MIGLQSQAYADDDHFFNVSKANLLERKVPLVSKQDPNNMSNPGITA